VSPVARRSVAPGLLLRSFFVADSTHPPHRSQKQERTVWWTRKKSLTNPPGNRPRTHRDRRMASKSTFAAIRPPTAYD